jgi:hypothetical protein
MDDLFRQASDQYPLRTNSSDWDKLSGALEANPSLISPQANDEQDNKRRRKRILWLFLPLLAGGIGYYAWQGPHDVTPRTIAGRQQQNQDQEQQNTGSVQTNQGTDQQSTDQQNKVNAKAVPGGKSAMTNEPGAAGTSATVGETRVTQDAKGLRSPAVANKGVSPIVTDRNTVAIDRNTVLGERGRTTLGKGNLIPARSGSVTGSDWAGNNASHLAGSSNAPENNSSDRAGSNTLIFSRDAQYSKVAGPATLAKGDISVRADIRSKWEKTPGIAKASDASQQKKQTANSKVPHKHSIYVGILGAPDLSTIDFQAVKAVGTTYGILAGYTINSKFSLETGVYLDKKKYYTDGQYFNTEKVPALQNPYYDLKSVNGDCNMVEIPLNLRYNLFSGKQLTLFATAGLSTYLMSKEWYAYQISSSYGMMNKAFTYTNPYHYLFSIVNLSFGYEQKLGKIGNLRIEPYLRIPLSGIGTGSLSILSAGLNLGITRRIW